MTDELPNGWARAPLSVVGSWGSGGTPSRSDGKAYGGQIPWLKIGDLPDGPVESAEECITEHGLSVSAAKLLPPDTLLVAMYGSIGKLGITKEYCATNQAIAFCRPHLGFELRYLFYLLMGERHRLLDQGQGGTQLNISQTILKAHRVPIAPSGEQKRIVSKIDELFSRIDEGERALQRVSVLVERYRQSVLKSAVTGELTRAWREKNKDELESGEALLARILTARREAWEKAELEKMRVKGITPSNDKWKAKYHEPSPPDIRQLPELPDSWCWVTIDALCFVTKLAGFEYTKYVRYDDAGDLAVLKAENAGKRGFQRTDFSWVRSESVSMLTRSVVEPGDLLIVFVGSVGNVARVPDDQRYFLGPNIAMMRLESPFAAGAYIEHYLRTPLGRSLLLGFVKAVAQPSLSMGTIRKIAVAFPPIEEQRAIVDAIEIALSSSDAIEVEARKQVVASQLLRQSVLKAAFGGQLVNQDPADEPASTLIERISVERGDGNAAPKRGRRKKATA